MDRRAPKKMGSSAMKTKLPYASAGPSGDETNLAAVAFMASVPLETVALRPSNGSAGPCSTSAIFVDEKCNGNR